MSINAWKRITQHPALDRLHAAWHHALAAFYRQQVPPDPYARQARSAAVLIWVLFLGGTALGVALYPQAVNVICDWLACNYPLSSAPHPLYAVLESVAALSIWGMCLSPLMLLAAGVVIFFRRQRNPRYRLSLTHTLATGWTNGANALLAISPLGPTGLVRVRFLARLHGLWRQQALIAAAAGTAATLIVAYHVLHPIMFWLGPWGHWIAQVGLVGLWCAALAVWLVNAAAHGTLQEVAYTERPTFVRSSWRAVAFGSMVMAITVPLLLWLLIPRWIGPLGYHDGNTISVVLAPLLALADGAVFAALNYRLAQWVLRVRLQSMPAPG